MMSGKAPVVARQVTPPAHMDWPAMRMVGKRMRRGRMNQEQVGWQLWDMSQSSGWRGKVVSHEWRYQVKKGTGLMVSTMEHMTMVFPLYVKRRRCLGKTKCCKDMSCASFFRTGETDLSFFGRPQCILRGCKR